MSKHSQVHMHVTQRESGDKVWREFQRVETVREREEGLLGNPRGVSSRVRGSGGPWLCMVNPKDSTSYQTYRRPQSVPVTVTVCPERALDRAPPCPLHVDVWGGGPGMPDALTPHCPSLSRPAAIRPGLCHMWQRSGLRVTEGDVIQMFQRAWPPSTCLPGPPVIATD